MTRRPSILAALAVAFVAGTFAAGASAQWAWKDDNGRLVYSNIPPPPSVKATQIVRQPGPSSQPTRAATPDEGTAEKPATAPAAPNASNAPNAPNAPKTYAERDAEFRKRQQERADSERKAQEEQQKAAQKATECERSRGYLRALEDGVRITRTDPAGNRAYLDDAQRAAEMDRMRKAIRELCN
jgi:type IV secretory pathway VirB10-like protein